ncbi:MAG: transcription antitermination factor NusB [Lachnospiraceae bacterium]|nr:transcription antitermination factor NusB [Lachnospiraceae bacterium]
MDRTKIRELTFGQLYLSTFYGTDAGEECSLFLDNHDLLLDTDLLREPVSEEEKKLLMERAETVRSLSGVLDEMINSASANWKTSRMSRVDLSILRLAVYEARFDDDIPLKVAINEAVELAKKYGGEESPSFINAILGKLARE